MIEDKTGENGPHLEITEVVLLYINIANNEYKYDSKVLYRFLLNKSFGKSSDISPKITVFLKTFNL